MTEPRICKVCGVAKPLADFPTDTRSKDGHRWQCRACRVACVLERRRADPQKYKDYQRAYFKTPNGIIAKARGNKKWRQGDKGRNYDRREDVRSYRSAKTKAYRVRNAHKEAARQAIRCAKSRGDIPAACTMACAHCGKNAAEYHHHKGYDPEHHLDVIPLCTNCHDLAG